MARVLTEEQAEKARERARIHYWMNREEKLQYANDYYEAHIPEAREYYTQHREDKLGYNREYRLDPERRAKELIRNAQRRAEKKNVAFDLDDHFDELVARVRVGKCELTGIPFVLSGKRSARSPSIDRVVPELGYVYSNIRLICFCLNSAFGNWGEEETILILREFLGRKNSL